MDAPRTVDLVPRTDGSELTLGLHLLDRGAARSVGDTEADTLLYVTGGAGALSLEGESEPLEPGTAALVMAGEEAVAAAASSLSLLEATVGPGADRHAPLGPRDLVAHLDDAGAEAATGARTFQILFGPHNGSTRATFFAGYIPPGKAPWHYHLYDEIVWVPEGPGRLHIGDAVTDLAAGSAFRLPPREVHILENASPDRDMTILGVFTPAGSPSAAYLTPEVAADYRFGG